MKQETRTRQGDGTLCGAVGIALNVMLCAVKLWAGSRAGSDAALADGLNNLQDAAASLILLIGFWISGRAGDREHPYGHGRAEYVAGLIVALLILLMGFELAQTSVRHIFAPQAVNFDNLTLILLACTLPVKLGMWAFDRHLAVRNRAATMDAAAKDSLCDVFATSAVLVSGAVSRILGANIDGWAGLAVSILIIRAGFCSAREAVNPLLGASPEPEFVRRVTDIVDECEVISGIHDLTVHEYGPGRRMVTLDAEVPGGESLDEIHPQIDAVERRLAEELGCRAVIHMDPADNQAAMKAKVGEALRTGLDGKVTIHDFTLPSDGEIAFHCVVPRRVKGSEKLICDRICEIVRALYPNYAVSLTLDRPIAEE